MLIHKIKIYLLVFILGALLGMFYDSIHVIYGVLHYTNPHFYGESLWVFPEFGLAAVQFVFWMEIITWKTGKFRETSFKNCLYSAVLLLMGYLITGWFVGNNLLTFLFLIPLAIITIVIHNKKQKRFIILITAIIGPVNEMVISSTGFFHYNFPTYIVPFWLPILWIIAAGFFLEISKYIFSLRESL